MLKVGKNWKSHTWREANTHFKQVFFNSLLYLDWFIIMLKYLNII